FPVAGLCVGVPEERPKPRPRLARELVVHENHYREPSSDELAALAPVAGYMVPGWLQSSLDSLRGLLVATGGLALAGGLYWAFRPEPEEDPNEVVVMGFGDVKLAGMLGAWLGFWPFLVGLMVAVLAGAVLGTAFRSRKVPFGPYLAIGGLVALFFGNRIVSWYLSYLGIG
ncbi:MAG: prepilin peptidase, partial [Deinococcus sp.]|nr:prepilin peptidase [Deinococcus sp.]